MLAGYISLLAGNLGNVFHYWSQLNAEYISKKRKIKRNGELNKEIHQ